MEVDVRRRGMGATCVVGVAAAVLAGCSGGSSGVKLQSAPATASVSASVTPSPVATVDPQVQAAETAYRAFNTTRDNALRHPIAGGDAIPPDADYSKYTFSPLLGQIQTQVRELADRKLVYKGMPPQSHVKVVSVKSAGVSWPTVTLKDCVTGNDWQAYKDGVRIADPTRAIAPFPLTVTMIYLQNHWGVYQFKVGKSHSCTV